MSLHDIISLWWPLAVFLVLYLQYKHKKERDAKVALARRLDSLQREHAMVTASNAARGTELKETRRQRDAIDEALGRARAERDAFEADARELGAAAALSRAAAFDAAVDKVVAEVAEPALSKILVAARGVARNARDDALKAWRLNGRSDAFRRNFATPAAVDLLAALGFAQGADGHYRVVAAAAAAGVASGFYATATRRLEAAHAARLPPLAAALGLAYLELDAGPKDGTCRPRWEPFEPAAAQRVYAWLAQKAEPRESPAACAERLVRGRGKSAVSFESGGARYDLYLGPRGELKQVKAQPASAAGGAASGYERSVSFMTASGRAYEPPVLCCGSLECRRGVDGTRDVDRDALTSRGATLEAALPAPRFEALPADSHAFLDAAALVRKSLAPALDGVRGVARGVVRKITGAGVSRKIASTEPPVVILAVHAVRNAERGAFFDLAVDQFAARGEPPNVTKAFHGTTLGACAPIAGHGFVLRDRNASVYGVGAYFSPAGRRRGLMALDPTYASPDAAGRQHLLLCSVARGESERLKAGGARGHAQMRPSPPEDGVRFTTGVDAETIDDASRLVVWGGILNTHVRVDAVVTLRCLDRDELTGEFRDGVDPLEPDPAEETTPEKARDD